MNDTMAEKTTDTLYTKHYVDSLELRNLDILPMIEKDLAYQLSVEMRNRGMAAISPVRITWVCQAEVDVIK